MRGNFKTILMGFSLGTSVLLWVSSRYGIVWNSPVNQLIAMDNAYWYLVFNVILLYFVPDKKDPPTPSAPVTPIP